MAGITDNFRPIVCGDSAFDDATLKAMSDAFDKAAALIADPCDEAIEEIAMRIITQASQGECDADKLAAYALAALSNGNPAS